MKLLCASNSIGFAQSLRIALEAEGIENFCSEPDLALSSIAGPIAGGADRVYILHENDWQRAVEILESMSPPPERPSHPAAAAPGMPRWLSVGLVSLGTAVLVALLASG